MIKAQRKENRGENNKVQIIDTATDGVMESQSVEANLLLMILEQLKELTTAVTMIGRR